ncbi:MAG: hypothetical protein AAF566_02340 [Pseudomonadota bacterium]
MLAKVAIVALTALVAACGTPSSRFMGAEVGAYEVDGMTFRVFRRADEVELLRSGGGLPRKSHVFLGAIVAIEAATGCPVRPRSMKGDQALITAAVDCID